MIHAFAAVGAIPRFEGIACVEEDAAIVLIESIGGSRHHVLIARCEEIAERSFERIGVMGIIGVCHAPIISDPPDGVKDYICRHHMTTSE